MKTAIVTGANSGMGKATSEALIKKGFHVIMACRNKARGQAALTQVLSNTSSSHAELMILDLASFASIDTFVSTFMSKHQRLDVLINNAGVILPKRAETKEGFEMQFGVNHIGHMYLTLSLLDILKSSAPSRIVVVSSGAHKVGKIDFNNLAMTSGYGTFRAYSRSKLANILFTKALAHQLKDSKVTVNCCHPGAVATNMGVNRDTGFGKGLLKFLSLFFLTPDQGADTAVYLASSDDLAHASGNYYYKRKIAKTSKSANDHVLANKLWDTSLEMILSKTSKPDIIL